jgi:hypothetical protein
MLIMFIKTKHFADCNTNRAEQKTMLKRFFATAIKLSTRKQSTKKTALVATTPAVRSATEPAVDLKSLVKPPLVLSFDLGVKKLAYCFFETEEKRIVDWNRVDLADAGESLRATVGKRLVLLLLCATAFVCRGSL